MAATSRFSLFILDRILLLVVDYPPARTRSRGLLKIDLIGKVYEEKNLSGHRRAAGRREKGKGGKWERHKFRSAFLFPIFPIPPPLAPSHPTGKVCQSRLQPDTDDEHSWGRFLHTSRFPGGGNSPAPAQQWAARTVAFLDPSRLSYAEATTVVLLTLRVRSGPHNLTRSVRSTGNMKEHTPKRIVITGVSRGLGRA